MRTVMAVIGLLLAGAGIAEAAVLDRAKQTGELRIGFRPDARPFSFKDAQGVAQGAAASFDSVKVHGTAKGSPYDLESINGIHAIRFQVDLSAPKDPKADPVRLDYGALVGRRGLALVAVVVDPKHAAEAEPMVRSILATASMPHPEIAHFGEHGGVFGERLALKIAELLGAVVALVLLLVLFRRGSLKKKAPAAR